MDLEKIFLEGANWNFVKELVGRTILMFIFIMAVLRLSGRRGVRQLTLFEVAIILALGSISGDPMFQEDIPIIYAVIVMASVLFIYRLITFSASRSKKLTRLLEGKELIIVRDGRFNVEENKQADLSQNEFFSELRNESVEHLGQVRLALLEVDGSLSILWYSPEETRYGLPLFPDKHRKIDPKEHNGPFACMFCGNIENKAPGGKCTCCQKEEWTVAIKTLRNS